MNIAELYDKIINHPDDQNINDRYNYIRLVQNTTDIIDDDYMSLYDELILQQKKKSLLGKRKRDTSDDVEYFVKYHSVLE